MTNETNEPAENRALRQLLSEQLELLDVIDELRRIGIGCMVELPQLIVCGNQSSGKSSVLEAISRVRFPAKGNLCTRFATEVILRRGSSPGIKVAIEPGPSRVDENDRARLLKFTSENFDSGKDLSQLIEEAKECIGISGDGFSDDVLKVEISGPDKPELSLVDLPGLYYSTSKDQGSQGRTVVRNLVERYMQNTRSIILAVITAKSDYHLQEVLEIAGSFDPNRERTIGVITQPDYLEQNSEEEDTYLQFIQNEKIKLQLGWHALRNRSSEDRDSSDEVRDRKETAFFNTGRWAGISRGFVGIDNLRQRLSKVLLSHIQKKIPDLITDINEKISERQGKLSRLGNSRGTLQEQRAYLLNIASRFEKITGQALDGMYRDEFFGGMNTDESIPNSKRLRAIVRELNEDFAEAMVVGGCRRQIVNGGSLADAAHDAPENQYLENWTPVYVSIESLEKEMKEQARLTRGIELPGSANQLLVGNLFRDQAKPWEKLAKLHLNTTWECVKDYVELLLQHLADDHTYPIILSDVLDPAMERLKEDLFHKLQELNSYNTRGHPLPFGRKFLESLLTLRAERETEKLETITGHSSITNPQLVNPSDDQFATSEIIDFMQAYYNIAISNFVENVAILAIENCLLLPLETIFTSLTVNNMNDSQIKRLASEPNSLQSNRELLLGELGKLQAGLRALGRYNTYKKRTKKWVKPALVKHLEESPQPESSVSDGKGIPKPAVLPFQQNLSTRPAPSSSSTHPQDKEFLLGLTKLKVNPAGLGVQTDEEPLKKNFNVLENHLSSTSSSSLQQTSTDTSSSSSVFGGRLSPGSGLGSWGSKQKPGNITNSSSIVGGQPRSNPFLGSSNPKDSSLKQVSKNPTNVLPAISPISRLSTPIVSKNSDPGIFPTPSKELFFKTTSGFAPGFYPPSTESCGREESYSERDHSSLNVYQTIVTASPFKSFSFEELRLGDYERGHIMRLI